MGLKWSFLNSGTNFNASDVTTDMKYNFDIFLPLIIKQQFLNKIKSPKSAVKRDIVIAMKSKAKKRRKCL